ncbi:MAG: ATP-binding protein [Polyangiaceae bacterium]|nr:ATP-binding protein [Polyangiaceae bacterium]MCL4749874.1 ATP-binding protein [Myxococcales bacterium]
MQFLNRTAELGRLAALSRRREGGLAVVFGRRRIGKTRLLLEWVARHGGLYTVADLSAPAIQRHTTALAVAERLPGFAEVEYPDWLSLLRRLASEAERAKWRGPFVLDELPYLVLASPELPSVLQRWLDHEAKRARLVVAVAGSSQRMMQGLVLAREAPLYGRAAVVLDLRPMAIAHLPEALGPASPRETAERWAAWGGVPRYWELAAGERGSTRSRIDRLVLDPTGPLHTEPDRLLLEEVVPATEVRPLLDAIGAGAHRVSEIAGRMGRAATSLSRPLDRLVGMGLVRREHPFGEPERGGKRSLYRIDDPFFRLWFRVVSAQRALLAGAGPKARRALLDRHWPALLSAAWEDLVRVNGPGGLGAGSWGVARRWWSGGAAEWDLVAESTNGRRLLLGEAEWSQRPLSAVALERACRELEHRPAPALGARYESHERMRALFVVDLERGVRPSTGGVRVVTAEQIVADSS